MLVDQYARGVSTIRERIFSEYLKHVPQHVNHWNLVDASAPQIIGAHLERGNRGVSYELARSPHVWSRRVAIMATFRFVKRGSFGDTLSLAELLLDDGLGLIHKAVGWMLR